MKNFWRIFRRYILLPILVPIVGASLLAFLLTPTVIKLSDYPQDVVERIGRIQNRAYHLAEALYELVGGFERVLPAIPIGLTEKSELGKRLATAKKHLLSNSGRTRLGSYVTLPIDPKILPKDPEALASKVLQLLRDVEGTAEEAVTIRKRFDKAGCTPSKPAKKCRVLQIPVSPVVRDFRQSLHDPWVYLFHNMTGASLKVALVYPQQPVDWPWRDLHWLRPVHTFSTVLGPGAGMIFQPVRSGEYERSFIFLSRPSR